MPSSDEQSEKERLQVRISKSRKQTWEAALDDDETLSHLVRDAVDRRLNDNYVYVPADTARAADAEHNTVDLDPIEDQLDALSQQISVLDDKIDTIHDPEDAEESREELAMDVVERLPTYPNDIPEHVLKSMDGTGDMRPAEYIRFIVESSKTEMETTIDGSAQRLSHELREPEPEIREALLYLERESSESVSSTICNGTRHWMRGL